MSKEIIATVRLQPGEVGYYDELSRIHLTVGNPQANIYAGMNCSQLRRSVQSGRLRLVSGSFGPEVPPFKLIRKGDKFHLAVNDAKVASDKVAKAERAESKKDNEKIIKEGAAEVKNVKAVDDGGDAKTAKAEPVKKAAVAEKPETKETEEDKKPAKKAPAKRAPKKAAADSAKEEA